MTRLCKCHNYPMFWHKDENKKAEGSWKCLIRKREYDRDRKRRKYREDTSYWLKKLISNGQYKRLRRIAQDELSHS